MSSEILVILGISLSIISFLLWLIFDIQIKNKTKEQKGHCPICRHILFKGEKIKSEQIETPKVEIKTFIKGCYYCLTKNEKRSCPICKKNLEKNQTVLAISYFDDPKKLNIKGCKNCFPQGYYGYESKYK